MTSTSLPLNVPGLSPEQMGFSITNAMPLSSSISRDLVDVLGKPVKDHRHLHPFRQEIVTENHWDVNARLPYVAILSMRATELTILNAGSWLFILAPIMITQASRFRTYEKRLNVVPHSQVPPGGIPRTFTWGGSTWSATKTTMSLMGNMNMIVLQDSVAGQQLLDQTIYGISVSAALTLQMNIAIAAVFLASQRSMFLREPENTEDYLHPQYQLVREISSFVVAAKETAAFYTELNDMLATIPGPEKFVVFWPGGSMWARRTNPPSAMQLQAWLELEDPTTKDIVRQGLPSQSLMAERRNDGTSVAFVEIPDMRANARDKPFDPLLSTTTLAQHYHVRLKDRLNAEWLGRPNARDITIYNLPEDKMVPMRIGQALYYSQIYATQTRSSSNIEKMTYDTLIQERYSVPLRKYVTALNKSPHVPRGQTDRDNQRLSLDMGTVCDIDFYDDKDFNVPVRDQFLMTSFDPEKRKYFIPEYVGSIERRFLPQCWVDQLTRGGLEYLKRKLPKDVFSVLNELGALVTELKGRPYDPRWFEAMITKNYSSIIKRGRVNTDEAVPGIVGSVTPADLVELHETAALVEFTPNAFGGLNLPDDYENVESVGAGCANGPMIRTLAAEALKTNSRYLELGRRAHSIVTKFDQLADRVNELFYNNDFTNPKFRSPWFHKPDILTITIENLFGSYAPAFLRVPRPLGVAPEKPKGDLVGSDVLPTSSDIFQSLEKIRFNVFELDRFYAGSFEINRADRTSDKRATNLVFDGAYATADLSATSIVSPIQRIVATLGLPGSKAIAGIYVLNEGDNYPPLLQRILNMVVQSESLDDKQVFAKVPDISESAAKASAILEKLSEGDAALRKRLFQYAILKSVADITTLPPLTATHALLIKSNSKVNIKNLEGRAQKIISAIEDMETSTETYNVSGFDEPLNLVESIKQAPFSTLQSQRMAVLRLFYKDEGRLTEDKIKQADAVIALYTKAKNEIMTRLGEMNNAWNAEERDAAARRLLAGDKTVNIGNQDVTEDDIISKLRTDFSERLTELMPDQEGGISSLDVRTLKIRRDALSGKARSTQLSSELRPDTSFEGYAEGRYVRSPLSLPRSIILQIFSNIETEDDRPVCLPGDPATKYTSVMTELVPPTEEQEAMNEPTFSSIQSIKGIASQAKIWKQTSSFSKVNSNSNNRFADEVLTVRNKSSWFGGGDNTASSTRNVSNSKQFNNSLSFDRDAMDVVNKKGGNNNNANFRTTAAPGGYHSDWSSKISRGDRTGSTLPNVTTANVFQHPDAERALRGPWKERMLDMCNSADGYTSLMHQLVRFCLLFTPNTLKSMQTLENLAGLLPFDVVLWRLTIQYQTHNILLCKARSMRTAMSEARVYVSTNQTRQEQQIVNQIDFVPIAVDTQGLVLMNNVAPAGYLGGMTTEMIADLNDMRAQSVNASVLATVQPLTEPLPEVVHFANREIHPDVFSTLLKSNVQSLPWSGSRYYSQFVMGQLVANVQQEEIDKSSLIKMAYNPNQKLEKYVQYVNNLSTVKSAQMLAFAGPYVKKSGPKSDGYSSHRNGIGPAGEINLNWPGAKAVWEGKGGQFPSINAVYVVPAE